MSTFKNIIFNILAVLLPILMLEGTGRLYYSVKQKSLKELTFPIGQQVFAPTVVNQDVDIFDKNKITEYYKYKPGRHKDSRGHYYTYNSAGFRDREFTRDKPPQIIRILTFGGSSTAEECVPDGQTWSDQLEIQLNARRPAGSPKHYQVYNFGMGGFTMRHIYNLLSKEGLAYKPDMIIVYSVANNTGYRDAQVRLESKFGILRSRFFGFLYANSLPFHRMVDQLMEKKNQQMMDDQKGGELLQNADESYDRYIKLILKLCQENGIRPVLVPEPRGHPLFMQYETFLGMEDQKLVELAVKSEKYATNEQFNYSNFIFYDHMMLANHMFRLARENNALAINVYQRIKKEQEKGAKLLFDFIHLNSAGCKILAEELAKGLSSQ